MKNYNPYDLVSVKLNSHMTYGRPVEFNSPIIDQNKLTDAFGQIVKPTKISTTCPDCGQGYTLDVELGEPPFATLAINCPICNPVVSVPSNPFVDPVQIGLVKEHHINPSVGDVEKTLEQVETTVADRMPVEVVLPTEPIELEPVTDLEPVVKPVVDPTVEHVIEPVVKPAIEPTVEPVAEADQKVELKPESAAKKQKPAKPKIDKLKPEKAKKEVKATDKSGDDFIDYGKKRSIPKAEEMTPEVDLDSLED